MWCGEFISASKPSAWEQTTRNGETPLFLAVSSSLLENAHFLLLNGCDPNAKNFEGNSPLLTGTCAHWPGLLVPSTPTCFLLWHWQFGSHWSDTETLSLACKWLDVVTSTYNQVFLTLKPVRLTEWVKSILKTCPKEKNLRQKNPPSKNKDSWER